MTAADARIRPLADVETRFLMDLVVDLDPRVDFGKGPVGRRILFGAKGGSFAGPRLRGEVLPGGGDWALFRATGEMTLDVRLTLRTDNGEHIQMTYGGRWITPPDVAQDLRDPTLAPLVDPVRYYCRTTPLFETGSTTFGWLNGIVCIGKGYLVPGGIAYRVCEVR